MFSWHRSCHGKCSPILLNHTREEAKKTCWLCKFSFWFWKCKGKPLKHTKHRIILLFQLFMQSLDYCSFNSMNANPILFPIRMSNSNSLSQKDIGLVKHSTSDWFRTRFFYFGPTNVFVCVEFVCVWFVWI